jgi:all-trans-retinol 13,14-reductase
MKNNNQYHILIIGSGLGGLVGAYILSKNGYKVAVLEKNTQIGGCLQTFNVSAFRSIPACIISVAMQEGEILYRFFKLFEFV